MNRFMMTCAVIGTALTANVYAEEQTADFAGGFVGGQIGYAEMVNYHTDNDNWYHNNVRYGTKDNGAFLGVRGGYNWVSDSLFYGVVAEYNVMDLDSTQRVTGYKSQDVGGAIDAVASLRGRVGITSGKLAAYVSGGLAHADIENNQADTDGSNEKIKGNGDGSGYVIGFGVDYSMTPNTVVGIEYSSFEFGESTHQVKNGSTPQGYTFTFENEVDLVSVSYSYKF